MGLVSDAKCYAFLFYSFLNCILCSNVDLFVFFKYRVNQGGDALAMSSQAEEDILHPAMPLDFSLKTQTLGNETLLSGSLESFSQSSQSDQLLSSLPFHKLQKSISSLTRSELLNTEQCMEKALQKSPKLLKPHISRYPPKTKSKLKGTTQFWDSCSSTSLSSQSDSPLIATSVQSSAFPVSSDPTKSLTHPECYQIGSNLLKPPMSSQSEEEVGSQKKLLSFPQQCFKPAKNTMLIQSSQSPQSDKVSSFPSHKCKKSDCSAIVNSSTPALMSHQQVEHTLQKALSPRHNDFHKSQMEKGPSSPLYKSAVDWDSSLPLSLQSHSPLLSSSTTFPASFTPKQSQIFPEDQCTTVYAKVPNPPLSRTIQAEEDKNKLTEVLQSPRLADFDKPQTLISSLNTTSTQSLDSSFHHQSHGPSPSISTQCISPTSSISSRLKLSITHSERYHIRAKTLTPLSSKSSSQTESDNTPSQPQPPSELQKSPLSSEQSSSDDEDPYFLPLGSSSSSAKSEILQSSPPLHLSSSSEYN